MSNQIAAANARLIQMLGEKPVIYGTVLTCAKSGMSRKIAFYCVLEGRIERISYEIALVLNLKHDNNLGAVVVRGGNMDMTFAVVYDLGATLYGDGYKIHKESL